MRTVLSVFCSLCILFLFKTSVLLAAPVKQQVTTKPLALIKSSDLFAQANNYSGQLSPNGKYFSYIRNEGKQGGLELVDLDSASLTTVINVEGGLRIDDYFWLSDEVLFLKVTYRQKTINYLVTLTSHKKDESVTIKSEFTTMPNGYIVDTLEEDPKYVLFSRFRYDDEVVQTLYKLPVSKLIAGTFDDIDSIEVAPDDLKVYRYESQKNKLMGIFFNEEDATVEIKIKALFSTDWQTLIVYKDDDFKMEPVGFLNENTFAMLSNKNADKVGLYAFDIQTQSLSKLLYEHPNYDLTDAFLSKDGELLAVEYFQSGLPEIEYLLANTKEIATRLNVTITSGAVQVTDANAQTQRLLVYVSGPNNPGEYYIYDEKKDELMELVSKFPTLKNRALPAHKSFKVSSPEGVEIEAFLTTPSVLNHNTLLVMPHGGPIGRRDNNFFNPEVQYLANRGFSVLRVNFRGSSGYGKAFEEQGVGQFGQQIEADISLVVDSVLEKSAFENVCAIGASYGAYSSFMLALKHPQIYKCIVAAYGIYDLPLLFNISNYRSGEEFEEKVSNVVGDNTDANKAFSPLYKANDIDVPVLLIAGEKDNVAEFEQSNRMRYMLEKFDKNLETLFFKNVGHGHTSIYGQQQESAYIVEFLMKKLGLELPDVTYLDEDDKTALAYDYTVLGNNFNFDNLLNIQEEIKTRKAFEYFTLASKYGNGLASFNLATYYQNGNDVQQDMHKAFALYELSATQGYTNAHGRLGRLYMGKGNKIVDSEKALLHLTKQVEIEDSVLAKLDLARLNCVAEKGVRDIEKCMDMFTELKAQANNAVTETRFFKNISQAIIYGQFSKQQREQFTTMAIHLLDITHPNFTLDINYEGYWYYQESEKFGRSGKYKKIDFSSLDEAHKSDESSISIGLNFKLEHKGLSNLSEFAFAVGVIESFNAEGELDDHVYQFYKQSGRIQQALRFNLSTKKRGHTHVVSVYDIAGNLKYRREYR